MSKQPMLTSHGIDSVLIEDRLYAIIGDSRTRRLINVTNWSMHKLLTLLGY